MKQNDCKSVSDCSTLFQGGILTHDDKETTDHRRAEAFSKSRMSFLSTDNMKDFVN